MFKALTASFCLSLCLLLAACGEGDSAPAMGGGPSGASGSVSSNVVKGLIRNGVVRALRWQDGAYVEVASTRTDGAGAFTLALPAAVPGEVLRLDLALSLDTRPGQRTEMLCDAARCGSAGRGDWVPLATAPGLSSWVSVAADGTLTVMPMTPVSTLLVRYAESVGSGHLEATALQAALLRVAALFRMAPADLLVRPGNIVDGVWLAAADARAVKLSLLAAAFAELSAQQGLSVDQVIAAYAADFVANRGHLLQDGGPVSLGELYRGMDRLVAAAGAPGLQDWATTWLNNLLAGLASGELSAAACAPDCGPFDSHTFLAALGTSADSLGGDLARVMQEQNVTRLEELLAGQLARYGWLASADGAAVAQVAAQVVGYGIMASLGLPLSPANGLTPSRDGDVLHVGGSLNGLQVNLDITLAPVLQLIQNYQAGTALQFSYAAQGTLENGNVRAAIDGRLRIDATGTDFLPLRQALNAFVMAQMAGDANAAPLAMQQLLQALADILRSGEARFSVDGSAGIARRVLAGEALVETSRLAVAGRAWLHVDMDGGSGGAIAADGGVEHGSLELPSGDRFTVDPAAGHFLTFALGRDGTAAVNLATHVLGHAATVSGSGRLATLGTLLTNLRNGIATGLQTLTLDLEGLLAQLRADAGRLTLTVNGQAVIPDFGHTYTLTVAAGHLRLSQPNDSSTALDLSLGGQGLLIQAGGRWWLLGMALGDPAHPVLLLSDSSGGEWRRTFDFSALLGGQP